MSDTGARRPRHYVRICRAALLPQAAGTSGKDLFIRVFRRTQVEDSVIVPAVPEPVIVWIVSGAVVLQERELGGAWAANQIRAGDFSSPCPRAGWI
jgi:AraC family transcriptional regulator